MLKVWLPTKDAARVYRVPERTLRRWHTEGRITARRRGRCWLWDAFEVEELAKLQHDAPAGRLPKTRVVTDSRSQDRTSALGKRPTATASRPR